MKNLAIVFFVAIPLIYSCGSRNEKPYSEPRLTGMIPRAQTADSTEFLVSVRDQFHQSSSFESVRKRRLTDFGLRNIKPPVYTPTRGMVQKAIIDSGITHLGILRFSTGVLVQSSFPFDYENDIDRLGQLAADHRLDTILSDEMTEVEELCALMVYTYRFLEGGTAPDPRDDPGPSAELITRRKREENIGGTSRHYAALFCQLALTRGFNARMVGIHMVGDDGVVQTHDVCEVYLNRYKKWAVFDPCSRATYYARHDVPQSALELREIQLDRNYRSIQAYPQIPGDISAAEVKERLLPLYHYIYIWRMNDILGKSSRNGSVSWEELYQTHLVWEDERSLVADGQFDEVPAFNDRSNPLFPLEGVRFVAHEESEFYWPLNYTIVSIEPHSDGRLISYHDTVTPNFKEFRISDEMEHRTTSYMYSLVLEGNFEGLYMVAGVNEFGKIGTVSYVDFTF